MEHFIISISNILQSPYFLLSVLCFSITVKIGYIIQFISVMWRKNVVLKPLLFLLVSITCALIGDVTWLMKLMRSLFLPLPYFVLMFFIRIAWAALIIQYQTLSLFLQALTQPQYKVNLLYHITNCITLLCSGYFAYLAFFHPFDFMMRSDREIALLAGNTPETFIMRYMVPFLIGSFSLIGIFVAMSHAQKKELPKILRKQIRLFMLFFITPYFCIEFILATWLTAINQLLFVVSTSTLMLALAIYYCLHKVLKVRFLNTTSRVHGAQKPHIIGEFKNVLRELSNATNTQEFTHITQLFFKEAFGLPGNTVHLTIREQYPQEDKSAQSPYNELVESFVVEHDELFNPLEGPPVSLLVLDEIAFNNFYEPTQANTILINFLSSKIKADVFLPIYSNKALVGYITIAAGARNECISHTEQDAMGAFASYLGNVINLLHHRNVHTLLYKEKKLKDSLYTKHQEINHYKESVHSFLRRTKQKMLGIVFYKNGHFNKANNDAEKLISIDPNVQEGHPLSKALKEVARYVETFNTPYTLPAKDVSGNPLLLSGVPHLKQKHTIITVCYPDISDVILQQMHLLHDPNDWDYLLYLSSTKTGALINTFIPANEERLLNIKIKLLKAALNKKALFLNVPDGDLLPTVKLLHAISLRETLHTLSLSSPTRIDTIGPTLFGTAHRTVYERPLLQKLHNGTLFIKDIHYLDIATQAYLTEFISCGWHRLYESEQTLSSNTRIICSSHQKLSDLVQKGRFSPELYSLLKKQSVSIPSLLTLPTKEQESLITGFGDMLINSYTVKNIFALTKKEKQKILELQPATLHELTSRVEQMLLKKTNAMPASSDAYFNSGFEDPELILAGRLGKQALKDEHIMAMLWEKFKNQNKIALFLGVNRSSVNRRFKAFQIGENSEGIA